MRIASRFFLSSLFFVATILSIECAHATGGSVQKVTLDFGLSIFPTILGYTLSPNEAITVGNGNNFNISIWRGNSGSAPFTFRLRAPTGAEFVRTDPVGMSRQDWAWQSDLKAVNPYGVWTAQVDDGPPFSWIMVAPPARTITGWSTTPNPPVAGRPLVLTISGSNLDVVNEQIRIVGVYSVTIPASALTVNTSTSVSATVTIPFAGSYFVDLPSTTGAFLLTVIAPTPTLSGVTLSPSQPIARRQLTLTVTGSDLLPTAALLISGPGCAPCRVSMSAPSTSTSATGTWTPDYSGSYTVTAQNADGATLSNAVSFNVTAATPKVTGASTEPRTPLPGQAMTLTVLGDDFDPPTAEIVVSGPGCATGCVIANNALTLKTWTGLYGPFTASLAGAYSAGVRNGRSSALSNTASFTVGGAQPPTITSLSTSPSPALAGRVFTLTVAGSGFDPATAQIVVNGLGCSPCAIPNAALTAKSSTSLAGSLTVVSSGPYSVVVQNRADSRSNPSQLTLAPSTPVVNSISTTPSQPVQRQPFQLTLSGDYFDPATALVIIKGPVCNPCTFDRNGLTSVGQKALGGTMTLENPGSYLVSVRNGSGGPESAGLTLNVQAAMPRITAVSTLPESPVAGQPMAVTLIGSDLAPASARILVYGPECDPCAIANGALTSRTETLLSGPITLGSPGTFTVGVQNTAGTVRSALSFTVRAAAPYVTSIATIPSAPLAGQPFTMTLLGSGFEPSTAYVNVTGPGCAPCVLGNSGLATKTSAVLSGTLTLNDSGSFTISVLNGSGAAPSNSLPLAVGAPAPTITGLTTVPSPAAPGQPFTLTVTGADFDPATAQIVITGAGCAPCSITASALTLRTATALAGSITLPGGAYTVAVRNGAGLQSGSLPLAVGGPLPSISRGGIVSAAGFQPALARGSIACLFGSDLAASAVSAGQTPLPHNLGGVKVQVEGVDAPLWYVSPKQINFQAPYESPLSGDVSVVVIRDGVASQPLAITLQPYAPGIFTYSRLDGSVEPIVTRVDGSLVTDSAPAMPGDELVLWGTGIGDLTDTPPSGAPAVSGEARILPTITVGSTPVEVRYAGLTPGAIGLAQFNIHLPNNAFASSAAELVIRFGQSSSAPVSLAVGNR